MHGLGLLAAITAAAALAAGDARSTDDSFNRPAHIMKIRFDLDGTVVMTTRVD